MALQNVFVRDTTLDSFVSKVSLPVSCSFCDWSFGYICCYRTRIKKIERWNLWSQFNVFPFNGAICIQKYVFVLIHLIKYCDLSKSLFFIFFLSTRIGGLYQHRLVHWDHYILWHWILKSLNIYIFLITDQNWSNGLVLAYSCGIHVYKTIWINTDFIAGESLICCFRSISILLK